MNLASFALPVFLICSLVASAAVEHPTAIDPDLPQPFDPAAAEALVMAPPFTRSLDLSDSLVLTGIAYIQGKPVVTILNKAKKESYVVSEVPNAQGWKLAETSATVQLNKTQAKIMVGSEVVTVRYSAEQLSPESMKKGGFKPGGGESGRGEDRGRGDDRRDRGRPSPETMKRIGALSEASKAKLGEEWRNSREKLQNASPEERQAYFGKVLDKLEKDDKKR